MKNRILPLRLCALTAALIAAPLVTFGQIQSPAEGSTEEETIVLSPFQVNADSDYGYVATSTLAGGRLATNLGDTPSQITVFTREFLDDIAANSYADTIDWAPNASNLSAAGITPGDDLFNEIRVSFRGLGGTFATRNYFKSYVNLDSYSTERIDFARGPNSIVYGDSGVGGIANIATKAAFDGSKTEVQIRFNDADGYRGSIDLNRALTDQIHFRLGTLYDQSDGWRERESTTRTGFFGNLLIKPWSGSTVRLEAETGTIERNLGFVMLDGLSQWDGQTVVDAPQSSGGFGGGVGRITRGQWWIYNATAADLGVLNYSGFGQTNGIGGFPTRQFRPNEVLAGSNNALAPLPDHRFHLNAPNAETVQDYDIVSLTFEQQIGENLFIEAAGNLTESWRTVDQVFWDTLRVDVNRTLPGGAANSNFGELYADQNRVRQFGQGNDVWDTRVSAAYLLDTSVTRQRFLALIGRRVDDFERRDTELMRVGGPNPSVTAAINRIAIRRYVDDRDLPYERPAEGTPIPGGGAAGWVWNAGFYNSSELDYLQLASSGDWLEDDRLSTIVGWRRDRIKREGGGIETDPVTAESIGWGAASRDLDESVDSWTGGAVFDLMPQLSLFANYAESFRDPTNDVLIDGSAAGAVLSDGIDLGLRLNLLDRRLIGSLAYYRNEETSFFNPGLSNNINAIWEDLIRDETVPTGYRDRRTFEGDGWEFELNYSPVQNWRILLNLALPDTALVSALDDTQAYYGANIGAWEAGATGLESTDPDAAARVRSNIQTVENTLESAAEGRPIDKSLDYTANLFTNYFFTEGRLKGFNLGGGANLRGARLIANRPGDPFDLVTSKGYVLFTLTAGYRTRVFERPVQFQLNVANLFDQQYVREEGYGTYTLSGTPQFVPDRFAIVAPRKITLTATLDF